MNWLHDFSHWTMRPDVLAVVCMAQISCLCAIYGGVLSNAIRKGLKPHGFFVRVAGFVVMHAFVFGALAAVCAGIAALLYHLLPHPWPPAAMLVVFLVIGLIAEESKQL